MSWGFEFRTEVWVTAYTGVKAKSLQEFTEAIKVVPNSSLFYHFYLNLFNYHNLPTDYPNSFAHWLARNNCEILAEKISVIDPIRYYDLEKLREDLLSILWECEAEKVKAFLEPFHFIYVHRHVLETGRVAYNLEEFVEGIEKSSIYSLFHHLITCRVDKGSAINDYSEWLINQGYAKKGEAIESIDVYMLNLYEVKEAILEVMKE